MSRPQARTHVDNPLGGTVRETVLPSGLRVLTDAVPVLRSASVGAWVGIGSRDESPDMSGASHFLEHLLFKGTGKRSAVDISREVEAVGGDSNAYTTRDYTCFYVQALGDDMPLAVDVLGDMICDSRIAPHDVEVERGVILEEIAAAEDDPTDVVHARFFRALFGDGPLGRDVAGSPETVRVMTPEQIRGFYRKHYLPSNLVVSAAGGVDHDEFVKLVREAFAPMQDTVAVPPRRRGGDESAEAPRALSVVRDDTEQAHLVIGCRTFSRKDERGWALGKLADILGGGMSSRLFQTIREERGLAYSVSAGRSNFGRTGSFQVYAGCRPEKAREVRDLVFEEMARIAEDGVTDEELARSKRSFEVGLLTGLEDSHSRMKWLGREQLLYDEVTTVEHDLERSEAITAEEVRAVAATILSQPMTTAAVGPFDREEFE